MRKFLILSAVAALFSASLAIGAGAAPGAVDDNVKINQIQVVGSHNSYHMRATQAEYAIRQAVLPQMNPPLDYEHPALGVQFGSQRVRQIELDVFADPTGGLYSTPLIRDYAKEGPLPAAEKAIMDAPGAKVLHIQDVDYRSNCLSFVQCLTQVKAWSDANPTHVPIAILVELKDDPIPVISSPPAVTPVKWTAANISTLDDEINSVFPPSQIIRPDDIRGSYGSVNAGVLADNWPTLAQARGKVMFLMDNSAKRADYLAAFPGLVGADIFTNAEPGEADAAFVEMNDPTGANQAKIHQLVSQGYVVRTRADSPTDDARNNVTTTRDAAYTSGAQWVSTDYPGPGSAALLDSPYYVEMPGGVTARCNPVNGPPDCVDAGLDTIPVQPLPPGALGTNWIPVPAKADEPTGKTGPGPDVAKAANPVSAQPTFTG